LVVPVRVEARSFPPWDVPGSPQSCRLSPIGRR
jgi:hypothetical protein